jgi:hypothetical protein
MKKSVFLKSYIIVILSIFCSNSFSQELKAPKVIISPNKPIMAWTIKTKHTEGKKENGQEIDKPTQSDRELTGYDSSIPIVKIDYVLKNPVSQRTVHHIRNMKQDFYYFEDIELVQYNRQENANSVKLDKKSDSESLFREAFPGVSWVKPKHYKGVQVMGEQECYYFKDENPLKRPDIEEGDGEDPLIYMAKEAWFSVATRMPVAFKLDEEENTYVFHNPENVKVIVPETIKKEISAYLVYKEYNRKRSEYGKSK